LKKPFDPATVRRVLIFRIGSMGDTAVALPVFHQIAKVFPNAERRLLTNLPLMDKAIPTVALLENSGLVHGYVDYPSRTRSLSILWSLRKRIRSFGPDVFIYMTECWRRNVRRDEMFFRLCGIPHSIGLPVTEEMRFCRYMPEIGLYEHETSRTARCVEELGRIDLQDPAMWDLKITAEERAATDDALQPLGTMPFIAASIGTKMQVKEWGVENWSQVMPRLAARMPGYGLVLVGSADEAEQSAQVAAAWPGTVLNLCGKLAPRPNADVLRRARLFLGQDSGNMHLAALGGTPCVAVFSAHNLPGIWFPFGNGHRVLYHKTDCYGCHLEVCREQAKKCILSITPDEVMQAVEDLLVRANATFPILSEWPMQST